MYIMQKRRLLFIVICYSIANYPTLGLGQVGAKLPDNKKSVIQSVDSHQEELIRLSDQIWEFAETALLEHKSSKLLADYAESQGFSLNRGIAGRNFS